MDRDLSGDCEGVGRALKGCRKGPRVQTERVWDGIIEAVGRNCEIVGRGL